ncbi:MAG: PspC domain-containing protein [Flavobacteriaceae bacterium]|nr:PspC domain-containing protein [Flavobacteriaceae bacterium]
MQRIHAIRHFFEKHGFEVSSRLGDRMGIKAKNIRLFFIYSSFAVGFGFLLYLTFAFWLRLKDLVYTKRTSVFDL